MPTPFWFVACLWTLLQVVSAPAVAEELQIRRIHHWQWGTAAHTVTPSLPEEASPQGPSALTSWQGRVWLLDTAGQRLLYGVPGQPFAALAIPTSWAEDVQITVDGIWLLQRGGPDTGLWQLPHGSTTWRHHTLPGGVPSGRWTALLQTAHGQLVLERDHAATHVVDPTQELETRGAERGRPAFKANQWLALEPAVRRNTVWLRTWSAHHLEQEQILTLQNPWRLLRDLVPARSASWVVWDGPTTDSDSLRWVLHVDNKGQQRQVPVCPANGPWQQLRVATLHNHRLLVVCPQQSGVDLLEVVP